MRGIIKGGICLTILYLIAVGCTLLISNRVQEIDSADDFRNSNSSLSIKFIR